MKIISDLHIHSCFSRACSKQISVENLEKYARIKGINLLGTGDFQHPKWIEHLKENLKEDNNGILRTKTGFPFLWQTEISLMYSQGGKGRRVHHVILAPDWETAKQITEALGKRGRLDYDGRPIFGFSSIELVDMMMGINKKILIIPAHAWTPWFGIFGSKTGFNSIEECFSDRSKYIYAIETGMSSDPAMNWRLSKLDKYNLVSFSDIHSFWPWRIGRECTVFELQQLTYNDVFNAIKNGAEGGLSSTIETDPGYGKYHFDGHRNCNVSFSPQESMKLKNICPVCKTPLTLGVENRVEELADRPVGFKRKNAVPFVDLIPLTELISAVHSTGLASKKAWEIYNQLITAFGNEFRILLEVSEDELKKIVDEKLAKVIIKNRNQQIKVKPGFDGEYGIPIIEGQKSKSIKEESKPERLVKKDQEVLNRFI